MFSDTPEASVSLHQGPHREDLQVRFATTPKPHLYRRATKAQLYLLAISQLMENGVVDEVVDALQQKGPLSETDVVNRLPSTLTRDQFQ